MIRDYSHELEDEADDTGAWLCVSDLMAGLVMIFALLLVTSLIQLLEMDKEQKNKRYIIIEQLKEDLLEAGIKSEVHPETGSFSLAEGLTFASNSSKLNVSGREFLDKLMPIYGRVIFQEKGNSNEVLHLVIEGHADQSEALNNHLSLSIRRAEAVVNHIENLVFSYKAPFLRKILPAGRGNYDSDPSLSPELNRNVTFRFEFQSHDLAEMIKSESGPSLDE